MVNLPPDSGITPARIIAPAGLLIAFLVAAVVPLAGVSCGASTHGLIRICYSGWGAVSGTPNVSSPYEISPDPATIVGASATLPAGPRLFAILTALVLLAGVASVLIPNDLRRAVVAATATVLSLVLLVATAVAAAAHAGSVYVCVDASSSAWLGVGDGPGVSGGFWLTLLLILATTAVVVTNLLSVRSAGYEADFGGAWSED